MMLSILTWLCKVYFGDTLHYAIYLRIYKMLLQAK